MLFRSGTVLSVLAQDGRSLLTLADEGGNEVGHWTRIALADGAIAYYTPDQIATRFGVIALDEGSGPDERLPATLADRLAIHLDLVGGISGDTLIAGQINQNGGFLGGMRLGWDYDHYWGLETRLDNPRETAQEA